jgi:hypothetical protein
VVKTQNPNVLYPALFTSDNTNGLQESLLSLESPLSGAQIVLTLFLGVFLIISAAVPPENFGMLLPINTRTAGIADFTTGITDLARFDCVLPVGNLVFPAWAQWDFHASIYVVQPK